jgi:predicted nucleic acid-binding protein
MNLPVVLDSEGLASLADVKPPPLLRALLNEARLRQRNLLVPAAVCAEVCRGAAWTRRVEAVVDQGLKRSGPRHAVRVIPTDFDLARQVGAILHGAAADSRDLVDAHVVAVCVQRGGGLVVTSDSEDIMRLAAAVPSVRIVTRPAR